MKISKYYPVGNLLTYIGISNKLKIKIYININAKKNYIFNNISLINKS